MTAAEIARACQIACRRHSVPSMIDELTAYCALKDAHLRIEEVAAVVDPVYRDGRRAQPEPPRCGVLILFNRFALDLARNDHMAHRLLGAARAYIRGE